MNTGMVITFERDYAKNNEEKTNTFSELSIKKQAKDKL